MVDISEPARIKLKNALVTYSSNPHKTLQLKATVVRIQNIASSLHNRSWRWRNSGNGLQDIKKTFKNVIARESHFY